MGYRLDWRLLGREDRFLDSGEIDKGFGARSSAMRALNAFLLQFPLWGRNPDNQLSKPGQGVFFDLPALA